MKTIKKSSEEEMIALFLKSEISSQRFSNELIKVLTDFNVGLDIISNPNLENNKENELRKNILAKFRGYGENRDLFENFPQISDYKLVQFDETDLKNISYINYSYWNELSNNTHSPLIAVKNIKKGCEVYDISNKPFFEGFELLKQGKKFEPVILITADDKNFVIVEGHSRLTCYSFCPKFFTNTYGIILKTTKKELDKWNA